MKKRLYALMLAVCVASTSIPMTALAEEAEVPVSTEQETAQETTEPEAGETSEEKLQTETDSQVNTDLQSEESASWEEQSEDVENSKDNEKEIENEKNDTIDEAVTSDEEEQQDVIQQETDLNLESEALNIVQERTGSLEETKIYELPESFLSELEAAKEENLNGQINNYGSSVYNSAWDIYSSNYIYNRLNDVEKTLWDKLDMICRQYLTQNINAEIYENIPIYDDYGNIVAQEDVAGASLNLAADCSYVGMSRANAIFVMFNYSNPQYYFLEGYLSAGSYIIPSFYMDFQSASARSTATNALKAKVNEWETQIATGSSEVAKVKIAHDLIINQVQYDHNYNTESEDNPFHQSAYSVFCDDHTVCAGYTKAFEMLMNGAGVDAMAVTSYDAYTNSGHAWNIVNINDSWYYVDCTWDDWDGESGYEVGYYFFNRSKSKLMYISEYNYGDTVSHVEQSYYSGLIPACTLDSGATLTSIGTCWNPTTRTVAPTITLKAVSGGVRVTLSSTTSGAEIYYTLNGTDPSSSFTRSYLYTGPFTVSSSTAVKARAVSNTRLDSTVSTKTTNGKSCKVVFKANGGSSVSSQYVLYNAKATKPKNPTKSGYTFGGWYTDSKCTKAYSFSTKLTGNKTLYAKWLKKYTVKFDANSGSVKTKSKKVTYTAKYGTLPSPKKKGYSFSGWYTKKSGGTKITANSKVKIKKTTTLYAHWKKITVKTTSVSKLQNLKGRSLKVTVKKVSGATGYQIRYSTKSNMKSSSTATVKNSTTKTISKLKKGKKYYVQVRAYKTDSAGKKVYGKWSQTKKITIRK